MPPVAGEPKVVATEEETAANAKRLAYEDSLRNAYTATFPTKENYKQLMKPNPNLTDEQAWEIIHKSEGNYAEIIKFLDNHTEENQAIAGETEATCISCSDGFIISWNVFYDYLCSFSDKDLRDFVPPAWESEGSSTIPMRRTSTTTYPPHWRRSHCWTWQGQGMTPSC